MKPYFYIHLTIVLLLLDSCTTRYSLSDGICNIHEDGLISPINLYNQINNCEPNAAELTFYKFLRRHNDKITDSLLCDYLIYYKKLNVKGVNNKAQAYKDLYHAIKLNQSTQFDSSVNYLNRSMLIYKQYEFSYAIGDNYRLFALNDVYTGNYSNSYDHHKQALKIFEELGDSVAAYEVQSDISIDLFKLNNISAAIHNAKQTLNYYTKNKDTFMQAYQESLLSVFYNKKEMFDSSKLFAQNSLNKRIAVGALHDIGESYNNLSLSHLGEKQWQEALFNLYKADSIMKKVGDLRQIPIIRKNIARAKFELGQVNEALQIYLENIEITKKSGQKEVLVANLEPVIEIYKIKNNHKEALKYLIESNSLNREIYELQKAKEINNIENKHEIEQRENKIQLLRNKRKHERIISLMFIIIASLIIALLLVESKRKKLQVNQIKKELDGYKKQLETLAKNISNKNKLIEELEASIKEETDSFSDKNEKLSQLYQLKILTEDDWQEFKILFDQVFPGAINKLREKVPNLTPAEERQFLLIKLKIDNSECASMLGISKEAVKKNRYRLKKKFHLELKDNLDDFVHAFE